MLKTEDDISRATNEELAAASAEELATALMNSERFEPRRRIVAEIERRKVAAELAKPFDPRADVSADAKYLWKRIFIWFRGVPAVLGAIAFVMSRM